MWSQMTPRVFKIGERSKDVKTPKAKHDVGLPLSKWTYRQLRRYFSQGIAFAADMPLTGITTPQQLVTVVMPSLEGDHPINLDKKLESRKLIATALIALYLDQRPRLSCLFRHRNEGSNRAKSSRAEIQNGSSSSCPVGASRRAFSPCHARGRRGVSRTGPETFYWRETVERCFEKRINAPKHIYPSDPARYHGLLLLPCSKASNQGGGKAFACPQASRVATTGWKRHRDFCS
jgi:hypothetical protein